jgi:dipeptidyl aminopeptidase/acylaminoacyl peptidase
MSQAIEMSRALKAQGVPTELHIAPNEGHDWIQPAHQLYKMNAEIAWIERHVRQRPYVWESAPSENAPVGPPAP